MNKKTEKKLTKWLSGFYKVKWKVKINISKENNNNNNIQLKNVEKNIKNREMNITHLYDVVFGEFNWIDASTIDSMDALFLTLAV